MVDEPLQPQAPSSPAAAAGDADAAVFLKFHYPELKDLGKHFLTVASGVLAFSVTFSEKVIDLATSGYPGRLALLCSWTSLILAVITSGLGLYFNYVAGAQAHGGIIRGVKFDYKVVVRRTYKLYHVAGTCFVLGLLLLASTGVVKVIARETGETSGSAEHQHLAPSTLKGLLINRAVERHEAV